MRNVILAFAMLSTLYSVPSRAQNIENGDYNSAIQSASMEWTCPDVERYLGILSSKRNDDYKIYADAIKEDFPPFSHPSTPDDKHLVTQTIFTIKNPLYDTNNLIDHLSKWLKDNGWGENMVVDRDSKKITSMKSVNSANHSTYLDVFKVTVSPNLLLYLMEEDKLLVSFVVSSYRNDQYSSNNQRIKTFNEKIAEVYPFKSKSTHKNTYAKAYVSTYRYFWDFISLLRNDLNKNFSEDTKLLTAMRYQHSVDSLASKYGEVAKVISDNPSSNDVNKEIRFYEDAQKVVVLGKTINFKDIVSCEITDDPKYIPGRSTTVGGGLSIFGFGLGGSETYTTPGKTIHNYVVNIKIDNLETPIVCIVTGQNESKAKEISASFDYILRRQNNSPKQTTNKKIRK